MLLRDFCQVEQVNFNKTYSKEIMSEIVMMAEQELYLVDRVVMKTVGGRLASLLNMGIKRCCQTLEQV